MTAITESTTLRQGDIHMLLETLREVLETARSMPLSNAAIVNRDEVLELVDDALDQLPEELRQARWLLKEREEFLTRARHEAEEITTAARSRAEAMVQRTEVVRESQRLARGIVDRAEAEARQIRNEAEDYVDAKLAGFEVTLERTLATVQKGRRRLQAIAPDNLAPELVLPALTVFDQDA
jgi:cell division septum initiation protein DivIVA